MTNGDAELVRKVARLCEGYGGPISISAQFPIIGLMCRPRTPREWFKHKVASWRLRGWSALRWIARRVERWADQRLDRARFDWSVS